MNFKTIQTIPAAHGVNVEVSSALFIPNTPRNHAIVYKC